MSRDFSDLEWKESDPQLDHAGDIDFLGWIDKSTAIGVQIKPVTANAGLGDYSVSSRMEKSFQKFSRQYGGKVFIVYSKGGQTANEGVLESMREEITRLKKEK